MSDALDRQVSGAHYISKCQHTEFCTVNNITWNVAACIKYVTRHGKKNGAEDLDKAAHFLELHVALIEKHELPDKGPEKLKISVDDYADANLLSYDEWSIVSSVVNNPYHVDSLNYARTEIQAMKENLYAKKTTEKTES